MREQILGERESRSRWGERRDERDGANPGGSGAATRAEEREKKRSHSGFGVGDRGREPTPLYLAIPGLISLFLTSPEERPLFTYFFQPFIRVPSL